MRRRPTLPDGTARISTVKVISSRARWKNSQPRTLSIQED
jgi:hypothetical protein